MRNIMMLIIFALCTPGMCDTFSAKGHKKSNGLNIEVHYPNGWTAEEAIRPHIVQKFVHEGGSMCLLDIYPIGKFLSKDEWASEFELMTRVEYEILFGNDTKVISFNKTRYEGLDGVLLRTQGMHQRSGATFYSDNMVHMLGYKDSLISLVCMSIGTTRQKSIQGFEKKESDFLQFGNGLVLLDLYVK